MIRNAQVYPDSAALIRAVAAESAKIVQSAASERGRVSIALAGGHSPTPLYSLWAQEYRDRIPWDRAHLFWGDERYVPPENDLSNYKMVRQALLEHIPISRNNVHPMPTYFGLPDEAARNYEDTLRQFFGDEPPSIDLVFLGVGAEGHTASLFPDSPALEEQARWVLAVEAPAAPPRRLTLTLPILNQARHLFFIAVGAGKREIITALRDEPDARPSAYPAGRVRPKTGRVTWFLDRAASSP